MADIMTYRGTVYPWHCDHMGHMNVMWYAGKFDEAAWNLFLEVGLTPSYLRSRGRGMAAVKSSIDYLREVRAGDALEVRSSITGFGNKALTIKQTMVHGEEGSLVARMETVGVYLDTRRRIAIPLPAAVRSAIRSKFPTAIAMRSRSENRETQCSRRQQ